jgi:hypothetical protein
MTPTNTMHFGLIHPSKRGELIHLVSGSYIPRYTFSWLVKPMWLIISKFSLIYYYYTNIPTPVARLAS